MSIPALSLAPKIDGDYRPQDRANGCGSQGREALKCPWALTFQVTWSAHPMSLTVSSDVAGGHGSILGKMEMDVLVKLARFF